VTINRILRDEGRPCWLWADTQLPASLFRLVNKPVVFDLSTRVDESLRTDTIKIVELNTPVMDTLPRNTEVAFYIIEDNPFGDNPYLKVQYVLAKR